MCDLIDSELGDFVTYNRPEAGCSSGAPCRTALI